jgi:uncharacterized protein (DUF1501 family)
LAGLAGLGCLPARAAAQTSDRKLVLILAAGGWDVSHVLDPKTADDTVDGPVGDDEYLGEIGGLPLQLNPARRPWVSQYFENWASHTAILNGVSVGTLSHGRSLARVLSGRVDDRSPDIAALIGSDDGGRPLGTVDLSGYGRFGPHASTCARWGQQGQARLLLDPNAHVVSPDSTVSYPLWPPIEADRGAVDTWLRGRAGLLSDSRPQTAARVLAWQQSMDRATALRQAGPGLTSGLPWGWSASAQADVDLVVELLRRDACRAVVASTRQLWDTHARLDAQHNSWNLTFFALDQMLSKLAANDLLEQTTVLVVSELGRTPRVNGQGGKDHWPWTSCLVAGGGVLGGQVLGGTDHELRGLMVDPISGQVDVSGGPLGPDSVLAGVAELLGMDPAWAFPAVTPCRGFIA